MMKTKLQQIHYMFDTLPTSFTLTIEIPKNFRMPYKSVECFVTDVQNGVPVVLKSPVVKARQFVVLKKIVGALFNK